MPERWNDYPEDELRDWLMIGNPSPSEKVLKLLDLYGFVRDGHYDWSRPAGRPAREMDIITDAMSDEDEDEYPDP